MNLELSLNEINIILLGLSKLPLEQSLDVYSKVRQQAELQLPVKQESNNA